MVNAKDIHILAVKDHATQAIAFRHALERCGCRVSMVSNGREALASMAREKPSVVVSDVVMPEMDGYELCARIKGDTALTDIPVILLTEPADPRDILRALRCGADHFVTKPCKDEVLVDRIGRALADRELVREADAAADPVITVAGETYVLPSNIRQVTMLLLSTYEEVAERRNELERANRELQQKLTDLNEALEKRVRERTRMLDAAVAENRAKAEALQKSEKAGRVLLNSTDDEALLIDIEGRIIVANDAFVKNLGADGNDLNGASFYDLLPKELDKSAREYIETAIRYGEPEQYEEQQGGIVRARRVFPIFDDRGKVERLALFARDITKDKKVDRMKTEFVSIASHELRTPLSNIMEAVSQVVDGLYGEINEEQQMILGIAHRNCDRMGRLIHDLLDISRIESGKIVLNRELFDISEAIRRARETVMASAKEKGIELRYGADSGRSLIYGDSGRLEQVLVNLLGNAVKFTPSGGIVTAEVGMENGFIRCSVSDTGVGIAPEHLDSIFEKFVTISSAAHGGESGTGLGLSIARQLVALHGGNLWAESEPGRGSRFIFRIPDYQSEAAFLEYLAERIIGARDGNAGVELLGIRPKEWTELQARPGDTATRFLHKLRDVLAEQLDAGVNVWCLEDSGELMIVLNEREDSLMHIKQTIVHQYEKYRFSIDDVLLVFGLQLEAVSYPRDAANERQLRSLLHDHLLKTTPFLNTPRKVLIVDDSEQIVKMLEAYLARKAIRVLHAYSGERALELVTQDAPDLILLDMGLPGISGYEVINRLKSNISTCRIPMIIITGQGVDREKFDAVQNGVPVLCKPFALNSVSDHMCRLLNIKEAKV